MQPATKMVSLEEAASWIHSGDLLALGGNVLHRSPNAFVRELARQGKKDLELVKTAGAYDIDLLCAAGAVRAVSAGFVGYENQFGLCPHYRKAVESGVVEAKEHACYTVISALRAASYGVPFMPVNGLQGSDLIAQRGFRYAIDPYTGDQVLTIPAITPDWAIIHVHEADKEGNARIHSQKFEDVLMTRAAKNVIITAERIFDRFQFERNMNQTDIPAFLVKGVVHAPRGAAPGSCPGLYEIDVRGVHEFLESAARGELHQHLESYQSKDQKRGAKRYGMS